MHCPIDILRVSVLIPLLVVVLGMANPPNPPPEAPILGGLSADASSISGIITECITSNEAPGACKLTIEVYTEAMALLNVESVAAPNWTLGGLGMVVPSTASETHEKSGESG